MRFKIQIEFNFRDAKQYWGLDDFINFKETGVTKATNKATLLEEGAVLGSAAFAPLPVAVEQ